MTPLMAQTSAINSVDASEATRRLFSRADDMPVKAGPLTLLYPKWIPGEHGPTGPIEDLVNMKITAGGTAIPWRRDLVDMSAFHIAIPQGVIAIDIAARVHFAAGNLRILLRRIDHVASSRF